MAVAAVAGYNVYTSQNEVKLSELTLANVEALANGEGDAECYGCSYTQRQICKIFGSWGACIGKSIFINV